MKGIKFEALFHSMGQLQVAALTVILLLGVAPFIGCVREERESSYQWSPVDAVFDSVVAALEIQFNDYAPFDTLSRNVARLDYMASNAVSDHDRRLMRSRFHYWRARYLSRLEDHAGAIAEVKKGDTAKLPWMNFSDSAKNA